mmetsp:Transcript_108346/g.272537  ORF Transcript_108346/g.272537 Transcript_108346/m.272537 type:complete len:246 (+) Transcript_108346:1258-1995(+)
MVRSGTSEGVHPLRRREVCTNLNTSSGVAGDIHDERIASSFVAACGRLPRRFGILLRGLVQPWLRRFEPRRLPKHEHLQPLCHGAPEDRALGQQVVGLWPLQRPLLHRLVDGCGSGRGGHDWPDQLHQLPGGERGEKAGGVCVRLADGLLRKGAGLCGTPELGRGQHREHHAESLLHRPGHGPCVRARLDGPLLQVQCAGEPRQLRVRLLPRVLRARISGGPDTSSHSRAICRSLAASGRLPRRF